jgi:pimeloyl-ACP methyl ester carboxylesterase
MIDSLRRLLLDRFVLRPSRNKLDYAPKERILATVDDVTVEYFVQHRWACDASSAAPPKPELLVLKFPGTAGRAERASDWPCELLPDINAKICTWNAPGYGASSGRATLANIPHRAAQFWNLATGGLPAPQPRIWLVGNSLGCATATYLASRSDVHADGLILRNPPPLIQTVKRVARRYPLGHLTDTIAESVPPEMNLSLTAGNAKVPVVLLQSEADQLVPPELQMEVYETLPGTKRLVIMEGLGHDGIATDEHHRDIRDAIRWLWRQSGPARVRSGT